MPRIFDNIDRSLLPALRDTLGVAERTDFCVGYFNLRGWKELAPDVERWAGGEGHCCRLLVGMHERPTDELRAALRVADADLGMDNQTALRLKKRLAEEFREQLTIGAPTAADEAGLRRLAAQIRARKVVVRLFLRHLLHAKLYLLHRRDRINPVVAYLGSSNLTFAGLSQQGELNVELLDTDAGEKLARWFEDRWGDRWCIDISDELTRILEESWAREEPIPPYHIYVKMAYHLSREARAGVAEFRVPRELAGKLFEFQAAAVKIAAHHLNRRGGVLIGDVVGLGKTLMATAVARIFEDDQGLETLIICPKNLVGMWEDHRDQYRLHARVLSLSRVLEELPHLRRYRLLLIDESHNLRNREGRRYRAIQDYVQRNDSKVILLSATPYNKTYLDLGAQLRLFVPEDRDIGIRPERKLREVGETEFLRQHQCGLRTLAAFEHSEHADDWRELMRLYLVRRTRGFIQENYAQTDPDSGRRYLLYPDGRRSYFPTRTPRTVGFAIDEADAADQYARLYAPEVVDVVAGLKLPRYGLGNYLARQTGGARPVVAPPTGRQGGSRLVGRDEARLLDGLSRAGKRLVGFCRTNLFKRLESSGQAFLQSVERHALRNFVVLHALERGLSIPLGPQEAHLLDSGEYDGDVDAADVAADGLEAAEPAQPAGAPAAGLRAEADFRARAAAVYAGYADHQAGRFNWLRPALFQPTLAADLLADARALLGVLARVPRWEASRDGKLAALHALLARQHPGEKVIVFTQFADTVRYLEAELAARGVARLAGVTGQSPDPTALVWRFSPASNERRARIDPAEELRVLVATDVLSEGQNLQDCAIVVNYDLPWAIIRLVQRAGRVDRIGQQAEAILCYSFLPAEGVDRIIGLRDRVRRRLREHAEVVGADELFFEDDADEQQRNQAVRDLYNERAGILDGEADAEVDLASHAYQIWRNATAADPGLARRIEALPPVVYSARRHAPTALGPEGALVYLRTAGGSDALARVGPDGQSVTESQLAVLQAAECLPGEPAVPRLGNHHELVQAAVRKVAAEERAIGGALGAPSGARFRVYERLLRHARELQGTLFESPELLRAIEEIHRYPLRGPASDALNRQIRLGISDEALAELVVSLRADDRLCVVQGDDQAGGEPQIICSLGLAAEREG